MAKEKLLEKLDKISEQVREKNWEEANRLWNSGCHYCVKYSDTSILRSSRENEDIACRNCPLFKFFNKPCIYTAYFLNIFDAIQNETEYAIKYIEESKKFISENF
jgi:hypothetical protein